MLSYQQQNEFVQAGLAKKSTNGVYDTFKYSKQVMYDYMWKDVPELRWCRGHTYNNQTGELILNAPKKTFNYLELDTWKNKSLSTQVALFKKYNGFMATARFVDDELIVGTTGSTRSNFATAAKKHIMELDPYWCVSESNTSVFEIIDENDPHIVQESVGAVVLGCQSHLYEIPGGCIASKFYPAGLQVLCSLEEALRIVQVARHEGFMMHDYTDIEEPVCKLKSPYYTGKKILMRAKGKRWHNLTYGNFKATGLPDVWIPVAKEFCKEENFNLTDQQRRAIIENLGVYKEIFN